MTDEINPEKIFETSIAFMTSSALLTGVELEVFTYIAKGNNTTDEVAKEAKADPRGMEMLLNSLVALNFLEKSNGKYVLSPISQKFLVKGESTYYGDFVGVTGLVYDSFNNLTNSVKTGKPYIPIEREEGKDFFEKLVTKIFPMSYPGAKAAGEMLGVGKTWKNLKILDVGAGSGVWSIAIAEQDPGTKIVAQDWPEILEITKKFVAMFGLNGRYNYIPGDLRSVDFGKDYDLIILGHICHSEGEENTKKLFTKVFDSLKIGGKLLIGEMVPDDERTTTVIPLLFALNMLINTTEGNTFTMREYREWLQNTGFREVISFNAPAPSPLIVATK